MAAPLIGQLTRHEIEMTEVTFPSAFFSPKLKHAVLLNIVNNLSFVFLSFSMNGNIMVTTEEAEALCPGNQGIMVTQVPTGQRLRQISPGNIMEMTQDQLELYPGKTS